MRKLALIFALAFIGAGCGDTMAEQAISPIKAPLEARNVAQNMISDIKANEANQLSEAGEGTRVAFILTEGSPVPGGAMAMQIIGCNDRVAFIQLSGGEQTVYRAESALKLLLAQKDTNVQGLYNPLSQSKIIVDKVQSTDGVVAEVWLSGDLVSGGACDVPRVKAQVEETVRLYSPVFKIYLNGSESAWRCFGDMSGQCE